MEFTKLTEERRSVRKYSSKKVTESQLKELIGSTLLAPTWKNSETGRYYAVISDTKLEALRAESLPSFNQKSSSGAALIVTSFVKDTAGFTSGVADNEAGNMWGAYDLGLQNAYLVLKARDMGLDTLIMGLRDADLLRKELSIPDNEIIVSVIAVGYRDEEPSFRQRKSVDEVLKIF